MTRTSDIISFTPLLRSTADDTATIERLQAATLEILERIGVCFPCEPALEIFRRHGAEVDGEGVVRLTPDLVERALATAPRSFVLGGREPRFDLTLDGTRTYLSTEGVGTLVRDAGDRRDALLAQSRRRAHGPHRRRAAGDLVLLAAGERPGPRPHCAAPRVSRRADGHAQARARRHHGAPAPRGADRRDGDGGRRLRSGAARATADLRQHLHHQPAVAGPHGHRGGACLRPGRHPS